MAEGAITTGSCDRERQKWQLQREVAPDTQSFIATSGWGITAAGRGLASLVGEDRLVARQECHESFSLKGIGDSRALVNRQLQPVPQRRPPENGSFARRGSQRRFQPVSLLFRQGHISSRDCIR